MIDTLVSVILLKKGRAFCIFVSRTILYIYIFRDYFVFYITLLPTVACTLSMQHYYY